VFSLDVRLVGRQIRLRPPETPRHDQRRIDTVQMA
jgi:hypothetical protein